jgi:hypothetical protein
MKVANRNWGDYTMKKSAMIATAAAVATMICSGVSAAPLTDYSEGKTAIDLTSRSSDLNDNGLSFDKKSNLDWGITTGLGNKFAIQYNGYNAKSKDNGYINNLELKTQEFNVLYQIDKNISAYTGIVKSKANWSNGDTSNEKSNMQFGLIGSTKIADKTTAYASVAVASDFTNWKIGVSQEIAPNLDFNVDYRRMQVKNLTGDMYTGSDDITAKGLGYGVTYKF